MEQIWGIQNHLKKQTGQEFPVFGFTVHTSYTPNFKKIFESEAKWFLDGDISGY